MALIPHNPKTEGTPVAVAEIITNTNTPTATAIANDTNSVARSIHRRADIKIDVARKRLRKKINSRTRVPSIIGPRPSLPAEVTSRLRERYIAHVVRKSCECTKARTTPLRTPPGYARATIQITPSGSPTFKIWNPLEGRFVPITFSRSQSSDIEH